MLKTKYNTSLTLTTEATICWKLFLFDVLVLKLQSQNFGKYILTTQRQLQDILFFIYF